MVVSEGYGVQAIDHDCGSFFVLFLFISVVDCCRCSERADALKRKQKDGVRKQMIATFSPPPDDAE